MVLLEKTERWMLLKHYSIFYGAAKAVGKVIPE
jgi:hypothetical protein